VLTDTGEALRGGAVWVYRHGFNSGKTAYAADPAYYECLREAQLNAVRVICFDPWQRSHRYPHYDFFKPADRERLLEHLDQVVKLAGEAGLYALINYHDVGRYDLDFAVVFWETVAPRYASQTHVFYELLNEPVEWFPEHYTDEVLAFQDRLYATVRASAPETHLVLLSFANTLGFVDGCTMESVVAQLTQPDWTNASVGFHPYYTGGTSAPILALRERFPVLCTEVGLPHAHGGADQVRPMDGDAWGVETLERIGVSWFSWEIDGPERLRTNFAQGLWLDAVAKGYCWNVQFPRIAHRFDRWRADAGGWPVGECNRVMGLRPVHVIWLLGLLFATAVLDALMLTLVVPLVQGVAGGDIGYFFPLPLGAPGPGRFFRFAALIFAVGLLRNVTQLAADVSEAWLYGRYAKALSLFAFERYLVFGKSFFDRNSTGRLNSLVDYHHDVLNLYQGIVRAASTVLLLGAYFSVMLVISWPLTLVGLVIFPLLQLLSSWFLRRSHRTAEEMKGNELDAGHMKWQMMTTLPLFRAVAGEKAALESYRVIAEQFRDASFRIWRLRSTAARFLDIGTLLALLTMLGLALVLGRADTRNIAPMLVFFFVVRLAMPELARFQSIEASFQEKLPKAREFADLFDDRNKCIVRSGDLSFPGLSEAIEFRQLNFCYPGGVAVLTDINLRIGRGQMVALVGPSGGGKSTLTHLLMRYYDVAPGAILVDGVDVREYSIATLRRQIAIVSQEVLILNQSLRQNLVFGLDRAVSNEEIAGALATAQLSDLPAALPAGLDTPLGDGGSLLSGGQRQRVAIARAMLRKASLLILDEATSALDSLTEAEVQRAIDQALEASTSLVIAHRLATIRRADRIVVLDGGRIVESGTLAELLAGEGLFARMWEQQTFS